MSKTLLSLALWLAALGLSSQDLSNGLLLYYDFNGNANDISGNGMHATVYGATLTNDKEGNPNSAYYFDGVDDFIEFPNDNSLKPQLPVTISCYVKVEDFSSYSHHRFFNTDFALNTYTGVMLSLGEDGAIAFNYGDGKANITGYQSRRTGQTPAGVFNIGEWVHIVAIARGVEDFDIYVNCQKQPLTYSGIGGDLAYSGNPGVLGKHDQVTTDPLYFKGSIDEVRYWNRALSPTEIEIICQEKGVFGFIYNDFNQNCIGDDEVGIEGRRAIIQPGNIVVETDSSGYWKIDELAAGTYDVTIDTSGHWDAICGFTQSFTVTDPNVYIGAPYFGLTSTQPCSSPDVSTYMPFMLPGFSDLNVYVQACNESSATGSLVDGYVDLALDELITVDGATLAYVDMGDNTFRFDVGTLNPGQCVNFSLSTTVSLDAVLGQTLCLQTDLFPVEDCVLDTVPTPEPPDFDPCDLPWDNSSILVLGECVGDSIVFTITNTGNFGDGDMDCFSPVRLYIDGEYIWLDSIQLAGGETFTYTFSGDGRTWRLEVDQHPLHPGNSHPNATVELCGDSDNWTPDLVNILPLDDADPIRDIYCGIVRGSYDPNDKIGYPYGVGDEHLIEPNQKIEYKIRFQNTGTAPAQTVKIIDTLEGDLDIFSVRSGVSSHNYVFKMHGARVLEWTFNNIQLPDSTTNEPESHGFVTFTVNQVKNLPDGTVINNFTDIYFDFNAPIRTDTTVHVIGRSIKNLPLSTQNVLLKDLQLTIYPNPNDGTFVIENLPENITQIQLFDVTGKVVQDLTNQVKNNTIRVSNIEKGIYFIKLYNDSFYATQRIVVSK